MTRASAVPAAADLQRLDVGEVNRQQHAGSEVAVLEAAFSAEAVPYEPPAEEF